MTARIPADLYWDNPFGTGRWRRAERHVLCGGPTLRVTRRNRAAERLVPGAELPHARVQAAAPRTRGHQPRRAPDVARTPDQNQSTKNIRNPRDCLTHHFLRWLSNTLSKPARLSPAPFKRVRDLWSDLSLWYVPDI